MTITIECSSCGQKLRAKDDQVGQSFACPKCGVNVRVPLPDFAESPQNNPASIESFTSPLVVPDASNYPSRRQGSGSRFWSTSLAILALMVSLCTAAYVAFSNPLGRGIEAYDFTTPRNAFVSGMEMELNQDFQAMLDLQAMQKADLIRERRDTFKIHREAEYGGKKILFITYDRNGIKQYATVAFEKDADSGYWHDSFVSTYLIQDDDLRIAIEEWEAKSGEVEEK